MRGGVRARAWLERHLGDINDWSPTECISWPFSTNGGSGGRYPQVNLDGRVLRVTRYIFESWWVGRWQRGNWCATPATTLGALMVQVVATVTDLYGG